jgi:hypothetical protein
MGVRKQVSSLVLSRVSSFEVWLDPVWHKTEIQSSFCLVVVCLVETTWRGLIVNISGLFDPRMLFSSSHSLAVFLLRCLLQHAVFTSRNVPEDSFLRFSSHRYKVVPQGGVGRGRPTRTCIATLHAQQHLHMRIS